jgi:hypothetical protein
MDSTRPRERYSALEFTTDYTDDTDLDFWCSSPGIALGILKSVQSV